MPSTADLYFTGEMSHHEVLAAIAKGTSVVLCKLNCY
jgi:putative NIF3 family GTP cyclohydrolase 1 type 2